MKKKRKIKLKKSVKRYLKILLVIVIGCILYTTMHQKEEVLKEESIEDSMKQETIEIPITGDELIDRLYQLTKEDTRILSIIENKENYPTILLEMLSRNIDFADYVLEYDKNKGKIFSNTIGKVKKNEYPMLLQYDRRWGYGMYGDTVMAINGCGPTAVSIIIAGLTGRNDITPYIVAKLAYQNGYYQDGTKWELFTDGVKDLGIIGRNLALSKGKMFQKLEQGYPIICSMRPGDFTTTGHLIAIVGIKDNQFIVRDPNNKERSKRLWSYEEIESQIKNLWYFETIE